MTTLRLTAAQALLRFLRQQYVARDGAEHRLIHGVFGIFGHGNVAGLGEALERYVSDGLPYFQPKNEQAMVHVAAAFAKARRRLGTFACTTSVGPGATNLVTGAAAATINRLPVLLLPGDVFADRAPAPVLQQLEWPQSMDVSVNDCLRPVSRYWDRLNRPEQLLAALPEAMRVLADPAETGAVTLCLPQDVQAEAFDYPAEFFRKRVIQVARQPCAPEALAEAARLLRAARRPLIVAGGGIRYSEAEAELLRLARATGIPVATTQAGKGSLPGSEPACLGGLGVTGTSAANRVAREADLVLAVGTRLSDFTTASKTQFQGRGVRVVGLNVNAADAHKLGALALVGDARRGLAALARSLKGWSVPPAHARAARAARAAWDRTRRELVAPAGGSRLAQAEVIEVLNRTLDADCTVVHAAGGLPGDLHKLWRSRGPDDYHSEYGYSCMGYEIAGALGVKLAQPERSVFALVGDGSYLMLHQELATAVQEGLAITVVLLDNHGYRCIHNLQRSTGSAGFGNEFRRREAATRSLTGARLSIDFAANAASLGAEAFLAPDAASLERALRKARGLGRPALIHVPVDPERALPGYSWWDVPVAEVSLEKRTRAARRRYEAARRLARVS